MKKNLLFLVFISLAVVYLVMAYSGLQNERIPGKIIGESSFYGLKSVTKSKLIEKMDDFKRRHRSLVERNLYEDMFWQFLPPAGYLEDMEKENKESIAGENIYISKNKMRWLSNNLMSPSVWDEQITYRALYSFNPKKFNFDPGFYRYGGAWLYPVAGNLFLASQTGIFKLTQDLRFYMSHPEEIRKLSMLAKSIGIISYLLAIFGMWLIARRWYNYRVCMLLVFFMVFCPVAVVETVYLKPLLTCLMWNIFTLYFLFRILEEKAQRRLNIILAGICAGFAAGTILVCFSLVVPLFFTLFYERFFPLRQIRKTILKKPFGDLRELIFALSIIFAVFFMTNPYVAFSFKKFLAEMSSNYTYHSYYPLWDIRLHLQVIPAVLEGLGWPLGLLTLVSLAWLLFNLGNARNKIILLTILVFYLWSFGVCVAESSLHALLPIVPLLLLVCAQFINFLFEKRLLNRVFLMALVVFVLMYSILNTIFYVRLFRTTPRIQAGEWVNKNIPRGASIGTFIDNTGLAYNYPYFNYFNYRFVNDSTFSLLNIKKHLPDYYIIENNFQRKTFTCPAGKIPLEYREFVDEKNSKGAHFRWKLNLKEEQEIAPSYQEVASFKSKVEFPGFRFNNSLAPWWTKEIKIYKLRKT